MTSSSDDPNQLNGGADAPKNTERSETPVAEASQVIENADVISELQSKLEAAQGDYLRALAELDNYRKRAIREMEQARTFAIERFAQELLPVMDGFELGLKSAQTDPNAFIEGQTATFKLLEKAFEKAGIRVVDPTGQAFDPNEHEAMVAIEAQGTPGTVMETIQKGYVLATRLIRPARVVVSKAKAD
jgi:molecular chaperone GrpE